MTDLTRGYFIAPDAYGVPCLWRENHRHPDHPRVADYTDAVYLLEQLGVPVRGGV